MKRSVSKSRRLAIVLLALLAVASVIPSQPGARALSTLYYVGADTNCVNNGRDWHNPDCWSLTSGGAGGAGPPTASTDVIFDNNSYASGSAFVNFRSGHTNVAHDILDQIGDPPGPGKNGDLDINAMSVFCTVALATLTFHSFVQSNTSGAAFLWDPNQNCGASEFVFSGTVTSVSTSPSSCTTAADHFGICVTGGWNYTGPTGASSMSGVVVGCVAALCGFNMVGNATPGKTIYVDPHGVDGSNGHTNVNFVFGPSALPCSTNCYWVGGSGSWSDGAHWSPTSGGEAGGAAPTSTSNVTFDTASGGGTVTLPASESMARLTATAFSGTIDSSGFTLRFTSMSLGGSRLVMGGLTITGVTMSSNVGNVTLLGWSVWAPSGPNIDFTVRLSSPTATLTVAIDNIAQDVGIYVNGVYQSRATRDGVTQTMSASVSWATSNDIAITTPPPPGGGGGGGGGGNPPLLAIVADPGSDGYTFTFSLAVPTGYVVTSVSWDFGDGAKASGTQVTHTFAAASYTYTVSAKFTLTSGYGATVTKPITPLGPANTLPGYLPLFVVVGAAILLVLVFLTEDEGRRILYTIFSLVLFWIAIGYVAVTSFPPIVPRSVFTYLPLAAAGTSAFMAATKENERKLVWMALAVTGILVWYFLVAAVG